MKTPIEMMIEKWESELGSYIPNAPIYKAFIEEAKTYLEAEKQQIIDAVTHGNRMEFYDDSETSGEQYYNSTFQKNKETLK